MASTVATAAGACFESGWCDLSPEHARVREEAERLVREYIEGSRQEYYMAVVVAPYGSGKTALLRHLEWYARESLGVPAARVEFSEIVDFIVERYGSIHESQLPRVLEEYVGERHGAGEGYFVLLVDEVEESYDVFRGVVEHETSPLRGLAEAVRTRSTRVYPVLALGPSSTLKEAVFGPVAWRSRLLSLPLLPKAAIHARLRGGLGDERLEELLANMAWWASKGRVAWARLVVEEVVPRLAEALRGSPEEAEALLLGDEALSREIVEGVPLFDRRGYREVKRFIPDRRLAPLLAALPGPVPLRLLEGLAGSPVVPEPGPAVGASRSGLRVDSLVEAATQWMERVARARDIPRASVDHAVSMLEHVLQALSLGGLVPYDLEFLRQAFSAAADLAREVYADDPGSAYLLETLNPDLLAAEPERMPEPVLYLRPGMLLRIYPVAGGSPLIGCARRAGPGQVREVVETLTPDELDAYVEAVKQALGLSALEERLGSSIYLAPAALLPGLGERLACRALAAGGLVLVAAEPGGGEARLPQPLRALAKLGIVRTVQAGPRLSMFIYSLLYNQSLGLPACSLEKLGPGDARSLNIYAELLKSLILDAAGSTAPKALRAAARLEKLVGAEAGAALVEAAARGRLGEAVERLRRVNAAASRLARLLPAEAPRLPDASAAAGLAEELAGEAEEALAVAERLRGCSGEATTGSRLLDILLGLAEAGGGAGGALQRLLDAAEAAPKVGPAGEAAGAARELVEALSGGLEPVAARLQGLLEEAAARLEEAGRLYGEVLGVISSLPEAVAERARRALGEDLAGAKTLRDMASMLAAALRLAPRLQALAEKSALLDKIEEARRRIVERLDAVFGLEEAPPRAGEEAKAEA